MNGQDMFRGLNYVNSKFIIEAETVTQFRKERKSLSLHRPVLIAAIVALLLMLVGCGVIYALHMDRLKIGEHTVTPTDQEPMALDVLSMQGIEGSPNHLAAQEWLAFTQSYEPERGAYWESPEDYWAYSVLDQTMVDKLDEICAKYGLQVIGKPWHEHMDCNEFLPLAGVDSLLLADSGAVLCIPQGRFFPGGSFTVYGSLELPDMEQALDLTYHCVQKDVFYDVFAYADPDTTSERNYTAKDGTALLLIQSDRSGMIMADREEYFISLSISLSEGVTLEQIADQFDFTILPKPIDSAAAAAREQTSMDLAWSGPEKDLFRRATYAEYVADILWCDQRNIAFGIDPSEIPERGYAFHDLDGNGEKDLLIYCNGLISSIVGWSGGKTDEGKCYGLVLCQDDVLIEKTQLTQDECWYHIFRFANNGDTVFSNPKEQSIIRLKEVNGVWWRTSSTDHYAEFDTQITEEEAMEILNAYTPVTLEVRPLTEFEEP